MRMRTGVPVPGRSGVATRSQRVHHPRRPVPDDLRVWGLGTYGSCPCHVRGGRDSGGRQPGSGEDRVPVLTSARRKVHGWIPSSATSSRRQRVIIAVGVILALVAGACRVLPDQPGAAAGRSTSRTQQGLRRSSPIRAIPARQAIVAEDVTVREVPLDETNAAGVATDVKQVIGRIPAVTILQGQLVTTNMLASSAEGGQFSILGPGRNGRPGLRGVACRVPITVSDDLAVGGLLEAGETVDVFVTADRRPCPTDLGGWRQLHHGPIHQDHLPERADPRPRGCVLHHPRQRCRWPRRSPHLQAVGSATFSMALRPGTSTSGAVDATRTR